MNLFHTIDKQLEYPIAEFGLQLAILRIDQLIEMHTKDDGKLNAFMESYIVGWLHKLFQRMAKEKALVEQAGYKNMGELRLLEEIKNFKSKQMLPLGSIDYLILFPIENRVLKVDQDEYLIDALKYSKGSNIAFRSFFNISPELNSRNNKYTDENFVKIFPLEPTSSSLYNIMEMEYVNNIASLIVKTTKYNQNKKFLISCERLRRYTRDEKKKFFRSFIRSQLLERYYQSETPLSNINLHLTSVDDAKIYNSALDEIIELLQYNYPSNPNDSWSDFINNHPFVSSGIIQHIIKIDPVSKVDGTSKIGRKKDINLSESIRALQSKVSTEDPTYQEELYKILSVLDLEQSILLLGETGTGKSTVAKAIHDNSNRRNSRKYNFVEINCAAIPRELIESELFGHKKGSFTHASVDYDGKIKSADKGTLFLDEIGKAPLNVQAKIMKFLDEHKYSPVGSNQEIKADIKIILATNEDPLKLIRSGRMLPDFFFRISKLKFRIPSLRERSADLENFIYLFKDVCEKDFKISVTLSTKALMFMLQQAWPGNIRQIENTFYQMFAECKVKQISEISVELVTKYIERIPTDDKSNSLIEFESQFSKFFDYWFMLKSEFNEIRVKNAKEQVDIETTEKRKNNKLNTHSFLKLIIEPLAANTYAKLGLDVNKSSEILGLSLGGNKKIYSPFYDKVALYQEVRKVFQKFE